MKTINLGLIGFGNIGTGVVRAVAEQRELIAQRLGAELRIARIADKDTDRKRDAPYDPAIVTGDAHAIIDDPEIPIIIELVGGLEPARTFVERALRAGKHVVTANKAMLASHGADLLALARTHNAGLYFEASIGGGIPCIRALQTGLTANNIRAVYGILNGTCNYILTHMTQERRDFGEVLAEAQAQGYAEPDPTFDVEGYDTAHKTAVLASLAFGQDVRFEDVFVEGISRLKPVDLENARELGYVVKLLGIAKTGGDGDGRIEVRVHPTLLPRASLLANVSGVFNAVMLDGDLVGHSMMYGRGAGPAPTASAVLSDCISLASDILRGAPPAENRFAIATGTKSLRPIAELETSYYLRFRVADRPGAMARLSGALADESISIASMIQRDPAHGGAADVLIVTHKAQEGRLQSALANLAASDIVLEPPFVLRVEDDL